MERLFPHGLNDEQKFIMIFFNLIKHLHVDIIEVMYLTAKKMNVSIPDQIYEILKVCRLSYHGSLILYSDIGDHTQFHPYFYEHVLKTSLNRVCNVSQSPDSDSFSISIKFFMAARYHKIKLCGRIINRILFAMSLVSKFDMFGLVLDYAIKIDMSPSVLTVAFSYFIPFPNLYDELFCFLTSNVNIPFVRSNHTFLFNQFLIVISGISSYSLVEEVLQYMTVNNTPISLEALDAVFGFLKAQEFMKFMVIALSMIDTTLYVPFGNGPFSLALWSIFKQIVDLGDMEKAARMLPLLIRTDVALADKDSITSFYREVATFDIDDVIMCKIRGFIQHFDIF
ncbi:hypothetical protein MXB_4053 [Myxobolus squamalis]|nr:hypothetical protein MXB_4053 [Myxobolus squamalis]